MKNERYISYIPRSDLKQFTNKKVAIYSRVSRTGKEKHHSIEAQTRYLERYVEDHPGWDFVGHYVDEGVTGTKLARPAFDRMMEDARAGKLDIILTKTVSRFGRNMTAVLDTLRELQALDVIVIFDNERLSTSDPDANLSLQFQGIQAEIESKQTSDYQKWAIRNKFKMGIPTSNRTYGLKANGGRYYVVPEEAKIVKQIFEMYLSGMGLIAIAKTLNEAGVTTINDSLWRPSTLKGILTNEKYTGDLLMQKTFRDHHLTKRKVKNQGELPKYLVEDAHEPIITKEIFLEAQQEKERRREKNAKNIEKAKSRTDHISSSSPRLFTHLIKCADCNTYLNYKHNSGNHRKLWVCRNFLELGKTACPNKSIPEKILVQATTEVLREQGLIKEGTPLTHDLLTHHIHEIVAHRDQVLEYHLVSGEIVRKPWQFISRKASWTEEMRDKAREKALARHAKNNKKTQDETHRKEDVHE